MINIYTDGACEPNPGAGGWGFVIYDGGVEANSRSGGSLVSTNNIMEMTAVLAALEYAVMRELPLSQTTILSDSQYCVKGVNEWRHGWAKKGWKRGNAELANRELWQAIAAAHDAFPCRVEWVKGHSGIIGNERADELADAGRMYVLQALEVAA